MTARERETEQALASLLTSHPTAWVGAMGNSVLYVPMPPEVPIAGHQILPGRWPLDHVAPADRALMSQAWRSVAQDQMTSVKVGLVTGGSAVFHLFNLTQRYEVNVLVVVAEDGADLNAAVRAVPPTRPRFTRVLRDEGGQIIEIDAAAPLVLGWRAEDLLLFQFPLVRFHPDDHGRIIDSWMSTLSDPSNAHRCRARHARSDGTWTWLEMTQINQLDDPNKPCVVSEMLDISDEMAAHEAVRAREQLLHRLAEALPLGVLQIDPDRRVVYRNDYLSGILGAPASATVSEQFASTIAEDLPVVHDAFEAALEHGTDHDVTIRVSEGGGLAERLVRVITKSLVADSGEVSGVIACISDVTDTTRMQRELEKRAMFDSLTGCHNRASVLGRLAAALSPTVEMAGIAVIFVDLDDFKSVNDRCGHRVGDEVLKAAAIDLQVATRGHDFVGRLGGDEFLVVCADVASAEVAMQVAHRISARLLRPRVLAGVEHVPRASIGVAWTSSHDVGPDCLVAWADEAMYASKREGVGEPHLWRERAPVATAAAS